MIDTAKVMAFVATSDGKRARKFYEHNLGLKVVSDDDFAIAFDANGTAIRIQKVDQFLPHSFTALGWEVADIDITVDTLLKRGVKLERFDGMNQDERGIWVAPGGARIVWFKDPDGNTLSLTQF